MNTWFVRHSSCRHPSTRPSDPSSSHKTTGRGTTGACDTGELRKKTVFSTGSNNNKGKEN